MRAKFLSEFIAELQGQFEKTGDGFVETYDLGTDGTVPFILWSEDDQQYYIDVDKEDE